MGQTWNGNLAHDAGNVISDIGGWLSGPPGDPGRIRQVASLIDGLRDRFDGNHRALDEAVDELTRTWQGDGASAFQATWYGGASGPAPTAVLADVSTKMASFSRALRDYADQLEHAQTEHWIQMGIMAALTIVNAVQLGADPATDAAEVGVAAGTAVGASLTLASVGTMVLDGAVIGFTSDVVSQLGADVLDRLDPHFDQTGDHVVSLFNPEEAALSGIQGAVGGALTAGGAWAFRSLTADSAAAASVDVESNPALRIYAAQGRVDAAERAGVLNPGESGNIFATDGQYEYGNIAQSNLAISARGENVAGYWAVPDQYASEFTYVGRVDPIDLWEGGGREYTREGPLPYVDLGPFHTIPWAAGWAAGT